MVTVITKTIGPSGRDYASFTLAEADVTNIGTSADLVANDEAIVFEADAGTYSEAVTFFSALTTDATRNVTYKAAAGSEHGGSKTSGVIIQGTGSTYTADIRDDYTALDGLVISQQSGSYTTHAVNSTGFSLNACIFDGESTTAGPTFFRDTGGSASDRAVISSCVSIGSLTANGNYFYTRVVGQSSYFRIINCTAIGATLGPGFTLQGRSGFDLDVEIVNCLALCPRGYRGLFSPTVAGSNNFGGSTTTQPFPVALQGSPYPITVTTDVTAASTGSQAIYVAGTGQLVFASGNDIADQGVGPSANSDVPTTGIAGETRSGATAQPGAFATLFGAPPPTPPPTQRTNLRYQIRRDTAANWTSANPVLRSGELGLETDTYKLKAGDGTSAWSALGYLGGGGGGVTDHGALTGLGDDDHTQYLLVDGTRAITGDLTTQALVPDTGSTYDLGENLTRFRNLYLSGGVTAAGNVRAGGVIFPDVTGVSDLGTGSLKFRDLWLGGAAYIEDTLEVGGTLQTRPAGAGLVDVGASSRKFRDGYFAGSLFVDGAVETDETLQPGAGVADADLGSSSRKWRDLWISRDIYVDGNIESTGNVQPRAGATTADLGSSSRKWRNLLMTGDITVGGTVDGRDITTDGTKLDGIEAGATNTNDPLADANQTITASRTIDDGDNGYQFFVDLNNSGASTAQLLVNPTTPQVTLSANNGTNTFIVQNNGAALNLICSATSTVQLNSDPGADGECFVSQGASAAPVYSGFPTVRSSTAPSNTSMLWYHTTDQELYAYDSSRSKWLSVTTYEAHFGRGGTLTANHYMRGPGGFDYNTGGENGHPMRYNTTVIAAWGSAASGGTSGWNHRIMRWDDSAGANGVAASYAPSGTYTRWQKTDFNVDYDTNDLLALNMFDLGSATGVTNHTAVIAYKRRAS